MLSWHGWPDSTKTHFMALKSMGIPFFTSGTSHLKFVHELLVMSLEHEELLLEQMLSLHQVGKDIPTYSGTDIYHMCRTLHFRWKGQCATEIQFLNTPHDRRSCRQAMTPLWCSSIDTLWFPQKTGVCTFATRGGGGSYTCHQDYVVTWQRRLWLLSIQVLICFW